MEIILKQERSQVQSGSLKRMTAAEHSMRVKFDYNLVDQFMPSTGYKRIFPLDPAVSHTSPTGEDLDEFYTKLEKMSQIVWKKQVGMVQKKAFAASGEEKKKKKGKNKRHLLTSMTFHIVDKTKQIVNNNEEEPPEDGLNEINEENI